MAKVYGDDSVLEVSTDDGTTWLKVGAVTDHSLSSSTAEVATTTKDSGGDEESIPGTRSHSVSLALQYDEEAIGFDELYTSRTSGTVYKWRWSAGGSTGSRQEEFLGYVTSLDESSPQGDVVSVSCTIKISGAITVGTVA